MKHNSAFHFLLFAFFLFLFAVPLLIFADTIQSPHMPYWGTYGLVSCTGFYTTSFAPAPAPTQVGVVKKSCTSVCDIIQTLVNIVYFCITLVLYVFTPIFFALGGIMYLISGASPGQRDSAKKILTGTLIGLLIVLFAFVAVKLFVEFFSLSSFIPGFGSSFNCQVNPPNTGRGSGGIQPTQPTGSCQSIPWYTCSTGANANQCYESSTCNGECSAGSNCVQANSAECVPSSCLPYIDSTTCNSASGCEWVEGTGTGSGTGDTAYKKIGCIETGTKTLTCPQDQTLSGCQAMLGNQCEADWGCGSYSPSLCDTTVGTTYACVAADGLYACSSSGTDTTCSSATGCTGRACIQIPTSLCGHSSH